jgi:hypothetical protein
VGKTIIDGDRPLTGAYETWHKARIAETVAVLKRIGAKKIVELGGHPWVMTSRLLRESGLEISATVSAEEITRWPDEIDVTTTECRILAGNREHVITNYSANVERTLFDLNVTADTVLACEIVEHLLRAPHVMFLNANRWLPIGGNLVVTTPNGCQFMNPFRRRAVSPAYRSNVYERHKYAFRLADLVELVTLCGFNVTEATFWHVYPVRGRATATTLLARLPSAYLREKFSKTLVVIAKKERDVEVLPRVPRVYDPRGEWEFIAPIGAGSSAACVKA